MNRWLCLAFMAFTLALPALAEGALDVSVKTFSDHLEVGVRSTGSLNPSVTNGKGRLELHLGKATLKSGGGTTKLDKGLLQRVEVAAPAEGVTVGVISISPPKNSLKLADDKKSLVWTVSVNDLATPGGFSTIEMLSARPSTSPNPPKTAPTPLPKTAPTPLPKTATLPAKTPTPDRTPAIPVKSLPSEKLPTTTPTPESPSTNPGRVAAGQRLVSLSCKGADLPSALRILAKAAGLQADLEPTVKGTVDANFTEIPLNLAISNVLGQQPTLYGYTLSETTLRVFGGEDSGGSTVTAPPAANRKRAREYFPILKEKKASEVLEAVKRTIPELDYSLDSRLNVIEAEGEPQDLERARKLLQKVFAK